MRSVLVLEFLLKVSWVGDVTEIDVLAARRPVGASGLGLSCVLRIFSVRFL